MIDIIDVKAEAKVVLTKVKKSENEFLPEALLGCLASLRKNSRQFWRNYGPYWWNMMKLMDKYCHQQFLDYGERMGGVEAFHYDQEIAAQFDYHSDILNYIAAQMYLEMRAKGMGLGDDNPHEIEVEDMVKHYIPGIGFIDVYDE